MRLFAEYQISLLGESYTGAVTVKYYGLEGHICSDEWDDADAQVACRELGFANGEMFNRLRTEEQQKPFWSSKFKCTGRERRLGDCNHAGWGQIKQCKSQHYAGVLCYDEQGKITFLPFLKILGLMGLYLYSLSLHLTKNKYRG